MVRTDFSDQAAWERVQTAINWVTPDDFEANVTFVDDRAFAGLSATELQRCLPASNEHGLLLIVDESTIRSAEHPVLVVNLGEEPDPAAEGPGEPACRSFRAVPHTIQEIENNLTIANMDWEDFVAELDSDGVLREHSLYGHVEDLPTA
ncbi:hypothetical protein SAMN05421837_103981 [Amycolatopsis pretoriensis]|uniref:DUF6924 domain-containing protein n=1 Tax=Amycolatopsis pretoriensis TaxID=218821 RepID=A0A1H5QNF4_9PSEU|nr:hypothetical protein SAMN05421837_103981 [Amycolatopsis pretoriensis]